MAFISDKERDSLVHKANKSYTGRKVFFFITMAITIVWIVLIVVFSFLAQKGEVDNFDWLDSEGVITAPGVIFIIIAAIVVVLDIISLILMLCVISPKQSEKVIKKLQSSALSGVATKKKGTNVASAASERMKTKKTREQK